MMPIGLNIIWMNYLDEKYNRRFNFRGGNWWLMSGPGISTIGELSDPFIEEDDPYQILKSESSFNIKVSLWILNSKKVNCIFQRFH